MYSRMLHHLLLSCLLYLSVYASSSQYSPRDVSKIQFPSVEKALVGVFDLKPGIIVGKVSTGATLVDAQVIGGTLDTVKTFSGPQLISLVEHGDEWAYLDNDGERLRLDGRVLIKAANGDFLSLKYTGIITQTAEVQAFVAGNVSTIPPGNIVISGGFETGSATYKELENNVFVGTGRLLIHNNQTVRIEYGLSMVLA